MITLVSMFGMQLNGHPLQSSFDPDGICFLVLTKQKQKQEKFQGPHKVVFELTKKLFK